MRASTFGVILIVIAAGVWYWRHEPPPVAVPRSGASVPAPDSHPDAPAHRGGAARSVRGALADGGAMHNDAARSGSPRAQPAGLAHDPASAEAPSATLGAAPARAPTADIAAVPAAAATDKDRAAADAPARKPAQPSAPAISTATPPPRGTAPSRVAAAAEPKPAADLFAPFVGDDPSQVFAPASATYHAAVQGETLDPDWGPAASEALRSYITGLFGDRFEVPVADCRQDLCELQIANRSASDSDADIRDLTAAMGRLTQQPWWNALGFDQQSGITSYVPDGRVIALWFFSRR